MEPQFVSLEAGAAAPRIAVLKREGKPPTVVWLGGFKSDMRSTKAEALDRWGAESDRAVLRYDYSGHGESGGRFEDGTIGAWLADSLGVIERFAGERPILVGSSMGAWLALLATLKLAGRGSPQAPSGLVLIAPAVDFTEALMWASFPAKVKREIERKGMWLRPSEYSPEPYPVTKRLIEEGRDHLLFGKPFRLGCPVHILQGMRDPDVPWKHAQALVEHLPHDKVTFTLIPDGDHRLSRDEDIARLIRAVERIDAP